MQESLLLLRVSEILGKLLLPFSMVKSLAKFSTNCLTLEIARDAPALTPRNNWRSLLYRHVRWRSLSRAGFLLVWHSNFRAVSKIKCLRSFPTIEQHNVLQCWKRKGISKWRHIIGTTNYEYIRWSITLECSKKHAHVLCSNAKDEFPSIATKCGHPYIVRCYKPSMSMNSQPSSCKRDCQHDSPTMKLLTAVLDDETNRMQSLRNLNYFPNIKRRVQQLERNTILKELHYSRAQIQNSAVCFWKMSTQWTNALLQLASTSWLSYLRQTERLSRLCVSEDNFAQVDK